MAIFSEKNREKSFTVLGENSSFNGVLKLSKELYIEGKFSGKIESEGPLYVAQTAACNVDHIKAASVIIEGSVNGNIRAEEKVEMLEGSTVHGDIFASAIKIADNVTFEGNVEMLKSANNLDIFITRPDVLKAELQGEEEEPPK